MKEVINYQMAVQALDEKLDKVRQYVRKVITTEILAQSHAELGDLVDVEDIADLDMDYTSTDSDGNEGTLVFSFLHGRGIDDQFGEVHYTAWDEISLSDVMEVLTDTDFLTWEEIHLR